VELLVFPFSQYYNEGQMKMTNLKVKIVTRITHRDELRTWDPATDEHHPAPLYLPSYFPLNVHFF
jgi:hypothetical protein